MTCSFTISLSVREPHSCFLNLSDSFFSIDSVLLTSVIFISQDFHIQELQNKLDAVEEDFARCSNLTEASSASSGPTWTVRQTLFDEGSWKARPQLLEAVLEAGKIAARFAAVMQKMCQSVVGKK